MPNPHFFGGPRVFCQVFSHSWYVPIYASETRILPLHDLAVLGSCPGTVKWSCMHGTWQG
jgi:hypothetical protein